MCHPHHNRPGGRDGETKSNLSTTNTLPGLHCIVLLECASGTLRPNKSGDGLVTAAEWRWQWQLADARSRATRNMELPFVVRATINECFMNHFKASINSFVGFEIAQKSQFYGKLCVKCRSILFSLLGSHFACFLIFPHLLAHSSFFLSVFFPSPSSLCARSDCTGKTPCVMSRQ